MQPTAKSEDCPSRQWAKFCWKLLLSIVWWWLMRLVVCSLPTIWTILNRRRKCFAERTLSGKICFIKFSMLIFRCTDFGKVFCASLLMLNICPEPSGWPLLNHGQTTSRVLSLSGWRRRLRRGSTETCDDDDIQHSFSRIAHDKKLATTPESGKSVLVEIGFGTSVLCNFLGLQQNKIQFSEP